MRRAFLTAPFPGVQKVGEHGARLGLWDLVVLEGRVAIPPADRYILGAWHPSLYPQILDVLGVPVTVCWTSSSGEVGFEPQEQEALLAILHDPRVRTIWFGHEGLAEAFPGKAFYAPYPVALPDEFPDLVKEKEKKTLLTLFCPNTPKKNIFNQLVAALLVQREMMVRGEDILLATNVPVPPVLSELRLEQHAWLPQKEYEGVLRRSRVNLACSWAETLHYQSIEACILGLPSVTSAAVPWLFGRYEHDKRLYAQAPPDDPLRIASSISWVLWEQDEVLRSQRQSLAEWAAKANRRLLSSLSATD